MTEHRRRTARLPASGSRWLREIALVWRGGWTRLRSRLWLILLAAIAGSILVWFGDATDRALLDRVQTDNPRGTQTARFISDHSDLVLGVPLALALWVAGAVRSRACLRRLGLACLMAALMAGLITQLIKRIPGRPRPDAAASFPDRTPLGGPSQNARLHSFPSGHTATSTATGVALVAAAPALAIPGALYAASVGWSRMQLRKHYPLDVAMGGFIGLLCGACFASTVPGSIIRLRRRKRPPPRQAD